MPQLDRVSANVSSSLCSSRDRSLSVVRGGSRRPERPRETVIIKSCNQLANLSSSVLIKPSPVISVSLVFSSLSSPSRSSRLLSFLPRPTHAKLFLPFHASPFRPSLANFSFRARAIPRRSLFSDFPLAYGRGYRHSSNGSFFAQSVEWFLDSQTV